MNPALTKLAFVRVQPGGRGCPRLEGLRRNWLVQRMTDGVDLQDLIGGRQIALEQQLRLPPPVKCDGLDLGEPGPRAPGRKP